MWKDLFNEVVAKVESLALSQDGIKSEIQVLTDLACHVESETTNPFALKAEKFFFAALIKYLQSKIV